MQMQEMNQDHAALRNQTNQYLDSYQQHYFKSTQLKSTIHFESSKNNINLHNNDPTRFDLTTVSDNGLTLDIDDKTKVKRDLLAYKDFISDLKFAHLELQSKLGCVQRIVNARGTEFVTREENDLAEQRRLESKVALKAKKNRVAELEQLMREEANMLEQNLTTRNGEAEVATKLNAEIEAMELELSLLKNKRSPVERITIEEATKACYDQCEQMAAFASQSSAASLAIRETKPLIASRKRAAEKLGATKHALMRKEQERGSKDVQDARAEEGCRWITHSTAFFSALQGIKSTTSIGSPATEMRLVYDIGTDGKEDERTLSIELGEDGRMTGAKLLESAVSIEDIVQAYVTNQDLRMLVQEVRTRISR